MPCLLALALATPSARADGVFGGVFAPQKRAEKQDALPQGGATAVAGEPLVPLQQQQVDICTVDGSECQSQITDKEGYFEFDGLKHGTYRLKTLGSDGHVLDNEIQVMPGQLKELSVIAK